VLQRSSKLLNKRSGRKHEPLKENPNSPRPKMGRQVKSKLKSMLIIFFDIKRIAHKEFVMTDQTVNSAYFSYVLQRMCENVWRLRPELWRQSKWLFHHNSVPSHTSFFTRGFLTRNNTTAVHPLNLPAWLGSMRLFSISPIEDKAKRPPFWHDWGGRDRIAGGDKHPHTTRLSGCI
jgi:hypothetical protein